MKNRRMKERVPGLAAFVGLERLRDDSVFARPHRLLVPPYDS